MVHRIRNKQNHLERFYYLPDKDSAWACIVRNDLLSHYESGSVTSESVEDSELMRIIANTLMDVCDKLTIHYQLSIGKREACIRLRNKLTIIVRLRKVPFIVGNVTDKQVTTDIAEVFHKRGKYQVNLIYPFLLNRDNNQTILNNLIKHEFNLRSKPTRETIWNNFKRFLYLFKRRCYYSFG